MKKIFIIFSLIFININLFGEVSSSVKLEQKGLQQNQLDENITGYTIFPSAYKQDRNKGLSLDFSLTNIIGEIVGKRDDKNKNEYTNPVMMSLISLTTKYTFNKPKNPKYPSFSGGGIITVALDLADKINSEQNYDDYNRPSASYGAFVNVSKPILSTQKYFSAVTLGAVFGGYSKMFSNFAPFYAPEAANIVYAGWDFNRKKIAFNIELIKPLENNYNPYIFNIRIKNTVPTLVFSYIKTSAYKDYPGGSTILGVISLRVPLYPPYSSSDKKVILEKKQQKQKYKNWQKKIKNLKL